MDSHSAVHFCGFDKGFGGSMDEIVAVGWPSRIGTSELDSGGGLLHIQNIKKLKRVHDSFEFMKTVRAFAQDIQQQVNLAGRLELQVVRVWSGEKKCANEMLARKSARLGLLA